MERKRLVGVVALVVAVGSVSACDPLSSLSDQDLAFRLGSDGQLSAAVCRDMTVNYADAQLSEGGTGPAQKLWEASGEAHLSAGSVVELGQPTSGLTAAVSASTDIEVGDHISIYFVDNANGTSSVAAFDITDDSLISGLWMDSDGKLSELPCTANDESESS
jgi:hypothetical protein